MESYLTYVVNSRKRTPQLHSYHCQMRTQTHFDPDSEAQGSFVPYCAHMNYNERNKKLSFTLFAYWYPQESFAHKLFREKIQFGQRFATEGQEEVVSRYEAA